MKINLWQIALGIMLALSFASMGAATSNGMVEVHKQEICVVDSPSFGFQLGPQNTFLCDVRLPAGFKAKVVYEGEQTFILSKPGIHIVGMTGAIKPRDLITVAIVDGHDSLVMKGRSTLFMSESGALDMLTE